MNTTPTSEQDESAVTFRVIQPSETIALRHSVLWPNAPITQVLLPEDNAGIHIGAFRPAGVGTETGPWAPIAVISLFCEPWPIDNGALSSEEVVTTSRSTSGEPYVEGQHQRAVRFRKFACDPLFQGRGVGSRLLEYSISIAKERLGGTVIWCDARLGTAEWYRKRGLTPFGRTFFKSDVEYVRMKRELL